LHASWSFGEGQPRVSAAASVNSPRLRVGYSNDDTLLDARNVDGPLLPWSVDLRGSVEQTLRNNLGLRLVVTGRTLSTTANSPRIGYGVGPLPNGSVGTIVNPVAPLCGMGEVSVPL